MCKAMEDMRNEALQEGRKEGIKENMEKTALHMLQAGKYVLEEIAEVTSLSLEDIRELQGQPPQ